MLPASTIVPSSTELSPIESYLRMGTEDLSWHDKARVEQLDCALRNTRSIPAGTRHFYQGWLAAEVGIIEDRHQSPEAADRHFHQAQIEWSASVTKPGFVGDFVGRVRANRDIALFGLGREILKDRVNHQNDSQSQTFQAYLGELAHLTIERAMATENPRVRSRRIGLSTELLFSSLLLDVGNEDGFTHIPMPATPRQEQPHFATDGLLTEKVKKIARDFTVITYVGTACQKEKKRTAVQVKTGFGKKSEDAYDSDSVSVVYRDVHMHVDDHEEAMEMARALVKYPKNRRRTIRNRIETAKQNILHELGLAG